MIRFPLGNLICRVWRTEGTLGAWTNEDIADWAQMSQRHIRDGISLFNPEDVREVITEIEKFDRIAAIEVLNQQGNGSLLYPDWK